MYRVDHLQLRSPRTQGFYETGFKRYIAMMMEDGAGRPVFSRRSGLVEKETVYYPDLQGCGNLAYLDQNGELIEKWLNYGRIKMLVRDEVLDLIDESSEDSELCTVTNVDPESLNESTTLAVALLQTASNDYYEVGRIEHDSSRDGFTDGRFVFAQPFIKADHFAAGQSRELARKLFEYINDLGLSVLYNYNAVYADTGLASNIVIPSMASATIRDDTLTSYEGYICNNVPADLQVA